jgi:succinate dehydrogenase/fumarate reductase cytochrome b subunit
MTLRTLHAFSALLITAFAALHLSNHLMGLTGAEAHIAFMQAVRKVYRQPVVETLLLLAVAFQIGSGLTLVARGWKHRRGWVPWLQAGSGAYLALFLLNHAGAVLGGRTLLGLDTNFHFAAAGFHAPPFQWFFAPYYFLGVLALFTHLGCALYWLLQSAATLRVRQAVLVLAMGTGLVVAFTLVLMLAGVLYPVQIPQEYLDTFRFGA